MPKNFKKIILVLFILVVPIGVYAGWFGPDSPPPLTIDMLKNFFCFINGNCTVENINITTQACLNDVCISNWNETNVSIDFTGINNVTASGCSDPNNIAVFYNDTHIICNATPILTPYDDSWINTTIQLNNATQNDYILYVNSTANVLDDYCDTDGKILKRIAGEWVCADDATGGGGGSGSIDFINITAELKEEAIYVHMYIPDLT